MQLMEIEDDFEIVFRLWRIYIEHTLISSFGLVWGMRVNF